MDDNTKYAIWAFVFIAAAVCTGMAMYAAVKNEWHKWLGIRPSTLTEKQVLLIARQCCLDCARQYAASLGTEQQVQTANLIYERTLMLLQDHSRDVPREPPPFAIGTPPEGDGPQRRLPWR